MRVRSHSRDSRLIGAVLVLVLAMLGGQGQPSDAATVARASSVGYGMLSVPGGSAGFDLLCRAQRPEGRIRAHAVVSAARRNGSLSGIWVRADIDSRYDGGEQIQVLDYKSVTREEGAAGWGSSHQFEMWSAVSGPAGPYTALVAWALWGDEAQCSLSIRDVPVTVVTPADAFGLYVPSSSFEGGIYYANGAKTIEAARTYQLTTPGGPVFASMSSGGGYEHVVGMLIGEPSEGAPTVSYCERPYDYCSHLGVISAWRATFSVTGTDSEGMRPGTMAMLALPPLPSE